MNRRRLLFVGNGVTLAHVARPLTLASSLSDQNYELHFACAPRYDLLVAPLFTRSETAGARSAGAPPSLPFPAAHHHIHTQSTADFMAALALGKPPYSCESLCRDVDEDLALLERVQPQLVIADFRLSMRIATQLRAVPYATITNSHWCRGFQGRYRLADMPAHPGARLLGTRNFSRLAEIGLGIAFDLYTRPMQKARRHFGLPAQGMRLQDVYSDADYQLLAEPPGCTEFVPSSRHIFLGPLTWEPDLPLSQAWTAPRDGRPLVYLSMGSSGPVHTLPAILAALAQLPVRVAMSSAGQKLRLCLPENVQACEYLPASAVLREAALAIGTGGSLMCHQCLLAGVPLLAIPCNMDQQMSIQPYLAGAAVVELRLGQVTPARVASVLKAMLETDRHQRAARALSIRLALFNPRQRFASFLDAHFARHAMNAAADADAAVHTDEAKPVAGFCPHPGA